MTAFGYRFDNVVDMIDRVADPGVFRFGVTAEIDLAGFLVIYQVFQQRIPADSAVNIRFFFFAQVNAFGITPPFKIENAVIVPAVFIVTYQGALGIGRKGGFPGAGKAEKYGRIAILPHVGRAVHGRNLFQGQVIVHNGEKALLDLAAIPGTSHYRPFFFQVKDRENLAVQLMFLPVGIGHFTGIQHNKIGDKRLQLFFRRPDKHVLHKVGHPGYFGYDPDAEPRIFICPGKTVLYVELFARKLFRSQGVKIFPCFFGDRFIIR